MADLRARVIINLLLNITVNTIDYVKYLIYLDLRENLNMQKSRNYGPVGNLSEQTYLCRNLTNVPALITKPK